MTSTNIKFARSIKGDQTNWIAMQTETFVNWINSNLSSRGMKIDDIRTAFEDGVKLVNLFEVISKRKIGKYAKNPRFHTQKLENVSMVLREMEVDGVKAVSIDSDHVVKGNFKMILGLIWKLIIRYQVGGSEDESIKIQMKKLLLIWLQHVIPEQNIRNLTTDWNSGIALCNLINVLQPGLCPEYDVMRLDTPVENVTKGLHLAEQAFGIPQIINAEYMARGDVDDMSMTTYLSYFTQDGRIGEEWTSDLIHEWNPQIEVTNFNTDWTNGHALSKLINTFVSDSIDEDLLSENDVENCRMAMEAAREKCGVQPIIKPDEMANPKIPELAIMAYVVQFSKMHENGYFSASGCGLIEATVGRDNTFQVCFPPSAAMECLYVVVLNPKNESLKTTCQDIHANLRKFAYIPEEPGHYTINISYEGKHISRSPYLVHILPYDGTSETKPEEVTTSTHLYAEVSERIGISVDTRKSGKGELTATTSGPDMTSVESKIFCEDDGTNTVSFTPATAGEYVTNVYWNNKPIAQSPFNVSVCDPCKCIAKQPVKSEGRVQEKITFEMMTSGAGPGFVTSYAEYVGGNVDVDVSVTELQEEYCCSFTPSVPGDYMLHVNYSDCPINGSPFNINIKERWTVNVLLDGNAEAFVSCVFHVDVADWGGIGDFKCFVSGPMGEKVKSDVVEADKSIKSDDKHESETCRFEISFMPLVEGDHVIEIYYEDEHDENGPYMVHVISPAPKSENVDHGEPLHAEVNEKIGISVDTRKSGDGVLSANTVGPDNTLVPTEVINEKDGRNTISFTPLMGGLHEVSVYWKGKSIESSPFHVSVCDPLKCILKESITHGLVNNALKFEVQTTGAGAGTLTSYADTEGKFIIVSVTKQDDECYSCTLLPQRVGNHTLHVKFNDSNISGSPLAFVIYDPNDASVRIDDDVTVESNETHTFDVHITDGFGAETLKCLIKGPDGEDVKVDIIPDLDGISRVSYCPTRDGRYEVNLSYGSAPVEHGPYFITVVTSEVIIPPDATQVVTSGNGLCGGYVSEPCHVEIDARNAGNGELVATVEGPRHDGNVGITLEEIDGIVHVTYASDLPGEYDLNIKWGNQHVSLSPFKVVIYERTYPDKVILSGNGLKEGALGQPTVFTVNGRNAGPGELTCLCRAPSGRKTHVIMRQNNDMTYMVDLNVAEPGLHNVDVDWGGHAVPGSPFLVKIIQQPDVRKVLCYGPGLKSGILDTFQGMFHVDTKGGGPGALKVRVNGPKGCFKVEMSRDKQKSRVINVKYNPTEPGIYTVNVFWSEEHVTGSPFEIFIAAKKSHLEKWRRLREEFETNDGIKS